MQIIIEQVLIRLLFLFVLQLLEYPIQSHSFTGGLPKSAVSYNPYIIIGIENALNPLPLSPPCSPLLPLTLSYNSPYNPPQNPIPMPNEYDNNITQSNYKETDLIYNVSPQHYPYGYQN